VLVQPDNALPDLFDLLVLLHQFITILGDGGKLALELSGEACPYLQVLIVVSFWDHPQFISPWRIAHPSLPSFVNLFSASLIRAGSRSLA
jgi:hypothetical protein